MLIKCVGLAHNMISKFEVIVHITYCEYHFNDMPAQKNVGTIKGLHLGGSTLPTYRHAQVPYQLPWQ